MLLFSQIGVKKNDYCLWDTNLQLGSIFYLLGKLTKLTILFAWQTNQTRGSKNSTKTGPDHSLVLHNIWHF